ncbi:hypothetical protein SMD44_08664 [Streptomyces alboflavus]|uniref:Uncharacterized protein n=1 Tax=Streptomyces alboflavus TaxID=67267 RepID=A0A1Z1WRZ8_9ACTN|nr:hypothetical protein SMD44_08664 [Streptomyces alboflavus]
MSCGVEVSSLTPVSSAKPTTTPAAAPPITATAISGTIAAMTLRNTSTLSSTISPKVRMPVILVAFSSASAVSTVSAIPPVKPVRMPTRPKAASASSLSSRNTSWRPGSDELPVSLTETSSKVRSGATMPGLRRGVCEWSSRRNSMGPASSSLGIVTRRLPRSSACSPMRRRSAAVRRSPSDRATSRVTVFASGFSPNSSSAIFRAAAESYVRGRKSPVWVWVTR